MSILKSWWHDNNLILSKFTEDIKELPTLFLKTFNSKQKLKTSFAPKALFANYSHYYIDKGKINFVLNSFNFPNIDLDENYYLFGNFNNWKDSIGKEKWRLKRVGDEMRLSLDAKKFFSRKSHIVFKFSSKTRWIEPNAKCPNLERDEFGNANLTIIKHRTGKHVLLSECEGNCDISSGVEIVDEKDNVLAKVDYAHLLISMQSDEKMGVSIDDGKTTFRLFAPRAKRVVLILRESLISETIVEEMQKQDNGTWSLSFHSNLSNMLYSYKVIGDNSNIRTAFDDTIEISDPYAIAMSGRNSPSPVLDRDKLPKAKASKHIKWQDLCIMECHIKDILAKTESKDKRTFSALKDYIKTNACYFKEAGINCIELQPIQEFDNESLDEYHWGYMPVNWFSPASAYASEPEKFTQIQEFRELVEAIHEEGFSLLLDVVYNHVGEPNHLLRIDKEYYFECAHDDTLMNYSGCGNDFRASSAMGKKLIVDSLKHLIEHYGVDGFRFDLAELLGVECLEYIEKELKEIRPDVVLIAEPWSFRGHIAHSLMHTGFSSWNDSFREFVRGYVLNNGDVGGLKYFLEGSKACASWPAQTVNYIESHDDMLFFDKISNNYNAPSIIDMRRYKIAYAITLSALGIPMLAEGFDFVRTKWGSNNTYKDGATNALEYDRALKFPAGVNFLRDLARFRSYSENSKAMRLSDRQSESYFKYFYAPNSNALGVLYNADKSANAKRLFVCFNPTFSIAPLDMKGFKLDNFKQIADIDRLDENGLKSPLIKKRDILKLPELSFSLWIED